MRPKAVGKSLLCNACGLGTEIDFVNYRAGAILEAEQHIRELATKLESSKSLMLSQQVEWHARLQQVEETCRG